MNLSKKQKKFIKKNLKRLTLPKIAEKIDLKEEELISYLRQTTPEEKLKTILKVKEGQEADRPSCPASPSLWLKENAFQLVVLASLVIAVYVNSLSHEFLSDDIAGIVQDKHMGNIIHYLKNHTINFSRYFFYSLIFKLFGLNQTFFRLLNITFHLGCVYLVYAIISLLHQRKLAFISAAIFAVHPILVESIVWITGGLYAQYSFFALLSFLFYLIAREKSWPYKYYLPSIVFFIPALLTTEKAAVLAPIIFAFEFYQGKLVRNWKATLPYIFIAGFISAMVLFGGQLGQRVNALKSDYYQETGLYNPLTQIPTAISSYLWLTVWPDKLTLYHSEMVFSNAEYALMALVTLSYLGLIIFTFIKKELRPISFWLSFFLISLIPMLTPLKVAWIVAERYIYLGSIGLFVVVGMGIEKAGRILKEKKAPYIILGAIILALSARTIIRNNDWKNQDTLWLAAARTSPSSPQNHNNLGDLYARRGDFLKAEEEFKKAIALLPNYGDAYHNLANTYLQMNKLDLALAHYQKALELNPNLWQSHQNMAAIYAKVNQLNKTEEHLKKAIAINSQNPILHLNLGFIYQTQGKSEEAKNEWEATLKIDPANEEAKKFLQSLSH